MLDSALRILAIISLATVLASPAGAFEIEVVHLTGDAVPGISGAEFAQFL